MKSTLHYPGVSLRVTKVPSFATWERQVVPMENPGGRERVEAGEVCLRKNGRDVDINRNWGVHWGHKEADYDPKEEYPGTAPFRWQSSHHFAARSSASTQSLLSLVSAYMLRKFAVDAILLPLPKTCVS